MITVGYCNILKIRLPLELWNYIIPKYIVIIHYEIDC